MVMQLQRPLHDCQDRERYSAKCFSKILDIDQPSRKRTQRSKFQNSATQPLEFRNIFKLQWNTIAVIVLSILSGIILLSDRNEKQPMSITDSNYEKKAADDKSPAELGQFTPVLFRDHEEIMLASQSRTIQALVEDGGRIIFIGDIHGCLEELIALLAKVDYDRTKDHIITTGDMINKGPDSAAVLELLLDLKASCVLGNHDFKILQIVDQLQYSHSSDHLAQLRDSFGKQEVEVARSLSTSGLTYLRSCPVILHVGKVQGLDLLVVHAGLVPSVPLHKQNPSHIMNMRIIDVATREPSPAHNAEGAVHWFQLWNMYQGMSIVDRRDFARGSEHVDEKIQTVIYGHDAKKGLQIHQYTRGLDTKCVVGGKLTALMISHNADEQIVQVDCKQHHR